MLLIVGLVLMLAAGFVATLAFALLMLATDAAFGAWLLAGDAAVVFVAVWLTYGLAFAAPLTLVALPAAYVLLRRRAALTAGRIVAAGVAAAVVLMAGFILVNVLTGARGEVILSLKTLNFSLVAAITGLAAGLAFARIMRWQRPADWQAG
jgi:hypothetical protein